MCPLCCIDCIFCPTPMLHVPCTQAQNRLCSKEYNIPVQSLHSTNACQQQKRLVHTCTWHASTGDAVGGGFVYASSSSLLKGEGMFCIRTSCMQLQILESPNPVTTPSTVRVPSIISTENCLCRAKDPDGNFPKYSKLLHTTTYSQTERWSISKVCLQLQQFAKTVLSSANKSPTYGCSITYI